jgi:hypothetical protein
VERPGIHLGVWRAADDFHVWGTTRDVPSFCLVVEVVASGIIVIKHRSEPFGKFVNVAVLEGLATRLERAGSMMMAMAQDVRQCVAEYRQKAKGFPS